MQEQVLIEDNYEMKAILILDLNLEVNFLVSFHLSRHVCHNCDLQCFILAPRASKYPIKKTEVEKNSNKNANNGINFGVLLKDYKIVSTLTY